MWCPGWIEIICRYFEICGDSWVIANSVGDDRFNLGLELSCLGVVDWTLWRRSITGCDSVDTSQMEHDEWVWHETVVWTGWAQID